MTATQNPTFRLASVDDDTRFAPRHRTATDPVVGWAVGSSSDVTVNSGRHGLFGMIGCR